MSTSNTLATQVLKGVFGSSKGSTAPATLYIALSSTAPTLSSGVLTNITEPSAGGYARLAVTNNDSNWTISGRVAANTLQLEFTTATGSWGSAVTHAVIYDASTSGNALASCALGSSTTVSTGTRVVLAASALTVTVPTS